jgi:hypothetical protein
VRRSRCARNDGVRRLQVRTESEQTAIDCEERRPFEALGMQAVSPTRRERRKMPP